jgi:quercetin dioxygenase-like cupin family protein
MIKTDWSSVPAVDVMPGVTRQTVDGANQTLVRYVYAPGAVFPIHQHPQEQITVVLSGTIAFSINGEPAMLSVGEIAVIPANVPHGAHVIGDDVVETLNMLSPKRDLHPST